MRAQNIDVVVNEVSTEHSDTGETLSHRRSSREQASRTQQTLTCDNGFSSVALATLFITSLVMLCPLDQSNGLNLNQNALGQLVNGNTTSSRLVSENLLVDRVHLCEVCHVCDEGIDLDNFCDGGSGFLKNGCQVGEDEFCVLGD